MTNPVQLIRDGDLCSLTFLALLLIAIGYSFLARSPALHLWGMRLAAAAFLGFSVYGAWFYAPYDASDWILVLLRALVVGALALGLASITLPAVAFLKASLIDAPIRNLQDSRQSAQRRCEEEARQCQWQQEEQVRADRELTARSLQLQHRETEDRAVRRRTNARAEVELRFARLAPRLGNRFTKEMLADYLTTYMGDDHSPDDVEHRGRQLITTLETHLQEEKGAETLVDLEQLDSWFQTQKQRIEQSSAEERLKRQLLALLNVQYAELAQKLMENLKP
jgi:hypothetical protein